MQLANAIDISKKQLQNLELPIIIGLDQNNQVHFADIVNLQHILMGGSSGSGKSTFEHSTIQTLINFVPKEKIRFLLIDMKRVDLIIYDNISNLITPVISDPEKAFEHLERLVADKNKNIKKIPNTMVIIDTFSDLILYDKKRFENIIEELTTDSANSGIQLLMSDSRLGPGIFTDKIVDLFASKICFNVSNPIDAKYILGSETYHAEELSGKGDLLYLAKDTTKPIRLQAPSLL